jgi:hypothetical protein
MLAGSYQRQFASSKIDHALRIAGSGDRRTGPRSLGSRRHADGVETASRSARSGLAAKEQPGPAGRLALFNRFRGAATSPATRRESMVLWFLTSAGSPRLSLHFWQSCRASRRCLIWSVCFRAQGNHARSNRRQTPLPWPTERLDQLFASNPQEAPGQRSNGGRGHAEGDAKQVPVW